MIDKNELLLFVAEVFNTTPIEVLRKRQKKQAQSKSAAISYMTELGAKYAEIKIIFGYRSNNSIANALRNHRNYLKNKENYKKRYICLVSKIEKTCKK